MRKTRKWMMAVYRLLGQKIRMKIRRKMTLIVLSTSIVTLVALSGIMFYGMIGARNMAIRYSNEIGRQSDANSSTLLIEEKKEELIHIASEKAGDIDYRLEALERSVKIAAATMQKIHEHPQDYISRHIDPPPSDGAGKLCFYVQYGPSVNPESLAYEMGISANIRDTLVGIVECTPIIDSIFVTTSKNYTMSVDNNLATTPEEYETPELHYDALSSDWYRLAEKTGDVAFTPVREFIFSKQLGIFCAVPYYRTGGELEGVACLQCTLKDLGALVKEVKLSRTGFCFVIDQQGHVILSSDGEKGEGTLAVDIKTDRRVSGNLGLARTVEHMVSGETGISEVWIQGRKYYVAYAPIDRTGWSFGAALAETEVLDPVARNNETIQKLTEENIRLFDEHMASTMTAAVVLVLVLLGAVTVVGKKMSDRFVAPIHILSDGVREIASGNLDKKIHIDTGDEIEHLAICFNGMTDSLKKNMESLARATEETERQNIALRKKNEELSDALHHVRRLRISRDSYRTKSELDLLTGLYNKAATESICENRCMELPEGMQAAFYIIDLDHFKQANDTYGHQYGDRILTEFALRLKTVFRDEDCVGRFGGDEFVVMMTGLLTEDIIREKALSILQTAKEISVDGIPSGITASIGIAVASRHGTEYLSLFQQADKALYFVKEHGRNGFHMGGRETG